MIVRPHKTMIAALLAGALSSGVAGCEYDMLADPSEDRATVEDEARLASLRQAPILEASPTEVITISQPATETIRWLEVRSSDFDHHQPIPARFGRDQRDAGVVPMLEWSEVPGGTKSVAVVVEDPDAALGPFVHLILYNLPTDQTRLRSLRMSDQQLMGIGDGRVGLNSMSQTGYVPPAPPLGDRPHSYHFQIFALDTMLDLPSGATKSQLISAMSGHVLAKGETVGTFQK